MRRRQSFYFIFAVVIFTIFGIGYAADLEIHCLDVGQGDCTLIISPTGGTFLFDAGWNGKGNDVVIPYLESLGITTLDYIGASHYHADHIGGIDEVVNYFGIDAIEVAVLDRGWSYTTQTYDDYAAAVAPKRTTISDGQVIDLGGGVTITCVAVNGNGVLSPPYDDTYNENDLCVALLVEYGNFEFFVAGDLSGVNSSYYHDIESSVASEVGDIDVYRVDHHGSASNSNVTLVSTLLPEVSIISVGDNSYGHPTQTVIDRLVAYGSYIYQTEEGSGGTIPAGHGEVVNGHIVITVQPDCFVLNGTDVYPLGESGVDRVARTVNFKVFPNPFTTSTTFELQGRTPEQANIEIYDVKGRLLRVLSVQPTSEGYASITWDGRVTDGRDAPPGVYFVRMNGGGSFQVGKVIKH